MTALPTPPTDLRVALDAMTAICDLSSERGKSHAFVVEHRAATLLAHWWEAAALVGVDREDLALVASLPAAALDAVLAADHRGASS